MSRAEGTWGEALVADYLRGRSYRLVAHSYRCRFGEIDLIAWDGDTLCFVEVKTRTNTRMGLPREYVTAGKQACPPTTWTVPPASTWRRSTPPYPATPRPA